MMFRDSDEDGSEDEDDDGEGGELLPAYEGQEKQKSQKEIRKEKK